mgnify:CR=1 FL=1
MAEMSRVVQSTYLSIPDGQAALERYNRRGELITSEFVFQAALDGRLYCASAGALTTPVTFGATATIDVTKPVIWGSVPSGTTIIPVALVLYYEAFGTSAQCEFEAKIGTGGARTSGGTLVTATNMRSDAPNTSQVTWYQGDNTPVFVGSTTNVSRFWRDGEQFAITKTAGSATASASDPHRFVWKLMDSYAAPVAVGASQIAVHQGSQAGTGFCDVYYVELPTVSVT